LVGVAPEQLRGVLLGIGYRAITRDGLELFVPRPRRLKTEKPRAARHLARDGHPFAKLKELRFA